MNEPSYEETGTGWRIEGEVTTDKAHDGRQWDVRLIGGHDLEACVENELNGYTGRVRITLERLDEP